MTRDERAALMRDIVCRLRGTGSPIHPADAMRLADTLDTEERTLRAALSADGKTFHAGVEKALARRTAAKGR